MKFWFVWHYGCIASFVLNAKMGTTVQFYVETPKIFQHFYWQMIKDPDKKEGYVKTRAQMSCTISGSTNGWLLQEMQLTHTANWDSNLGWLIARLPSLLDLSSLSTDYVVNSWLQFLELFTSRDTVTWQTVHNPMLSPMLSPILLLSPLLSDTTPWHQWQPKASFHCGFYRRSLPSRLENKEPVSYGLSPLTAHMQEQM